MLSKRLNYNLSQKIGKKSNTAYNGSGNSCVDAALIYHIEMACYERRTIVGLLYATKRALW